MDESGYIPIATFSSPPDPNNDHSLVTITFDTDLRSAIDGTNNLYKIMNTFLSSDKNYFPNFRIINSTTNFKVADQPVYKYSILYKDPEFSQTQFREMIGTVNERVHYFFIIESPLEIYPKYANTVNSVIETIQFPQNKNQ